HEIRTPLHGIVGFIDLLHQTPLNDEQIKYLKNARASSENLLEIINDILDFSKIEAGKMEIKESETDFLVLIEDTISLIRPAADKKNLSLNVVLDENLPRFVNLDALRLRQVLLNLLSNAIKFTDSGKVDLNIRFKQQPQNPVTGLFKFTVT